MLHKLFFTFIFCFSIQTISAQKFLLLDNYKYRRVRLEIGDRIIFKVRGDKKRYSDIILDLEDSLIYLQKHHMALNINEIRKVYFHRDELMYFTRGQQVLGMGYMMAGLVHPLIKDPQYSGGEQLIIGASLVVLGQILHLFRHKRRSIGNCYRLRIIDLSYDEYQLQ